MKPQAIGPCLALLFFVITVPAAVHRFDAKYMGGTVPGLEEETDGLTHATDAELFTFEHKKGTLVIPYRQILSIEYGQTLGHHGASTMTAAAMTAGPAGILAARLAKQRHHYLTLEYRDENQQFQVAVFELGKDRIYPTLYNLKTKSGKKLEFQDEESRKEVLRLTP